MQTDTTDPFLQLGWLQLLLAYWPVFAVAFVTAVVCTPVMRLVATKYGIVDAPDDARKMHTKVTPYLGGAAVFLAVSAGICMSYAYAVDPHFQPFPLVVLLGMVAIGVTGIADDVLTYFDPWWKIAGQLVAAAAMAQQGVGTRVAEGFLRGIAGVPESVCNYPLIGAAEIMPDPITLTYITGLIIIVAFVLGACNAANLLDGLDGLLSGVVAITCVGFIAISLLIATSMTTADLQDIANHLPKNMFLNNNQGQGITLIGADLVLSISVLGAVLGFLVYNFNPASIFLGDAGSLLLGYLCIVMALMLGEKGQTYLVVAGLIVFALPILDTLLAIIRRKMAGKSIAEPDSNHIHHIIKRKTGSVKKTVLLLYVVSFVFCVLGVALAWAHITEAIRSWVIYLVAVVIFGGISLLALNAAKKHERENSTQ